MPKIVDHQQRRELIASETAKLIALRGLESVTFREVARICSVSRGVIAHYFTSKADLVDTALEWANNNYLARVEDELEGSQGLAALTIRMNNILPVTEQNRIEWRIRLQFWAKTALDSELGSIQSQRFEGASEYFLSDLKTAKKNGEVSPELSLAETTKNLLSYSIGLSIMSMHNPEEYTPLRLKRSINKYISSISLH